MTRQIFSLYRGLKLAVLGMLLLAPAAYAKTIDSTSLEEWHNPNSQVFKYLNSYAIADMLYDNALKANNKILFHCDERYNISIGEVTVIQPIQFEKTINHPKTGFWHHRYTLFRCNRDITYNVYFVAQNKMPPRAIAGPLGNTLLSVTAIVELTPIVYKAAAELLQCGGEDFSNTAFTSNTLIVAQPNEREGKRTWQEEWHIYACADTAIITIECIQTLADQKMEYKIISAHRS